MEPDEFDDATPKCPACMHSLEPRGDGKRAWWVCPSCGFVRL